MAGAGIGAIGGLGNNIQFNVVEPGVLEIQNPIEIGDALFPEALLDANPLTEECDVIKVRVNVPEVTIDAYYDVMNQLLRERAHVSFDREERIGGLGFEITTATRQLEVGDLGEEPYNFSIDVLGERNRRVRELLGADQWLNVEGILPIANTRSAAFSAPQFTVFGEGALDPLSREAHHFGVFYYLGKGRQDVRFIPREFGRDEFQTHMRQRLLYNRNYRGNLICPNFIEEANIYFDEFFLRDDYGAKSIELHAGEAIILQAGTYFQVDTLRSSFAVSFACVPNRWMNETGIELCDHCDTPLTMDDLDDIKEKAIQVKNYANRRMRLNNPPPVINVIPPAFPRRIAALHNDDEEEQEPVLEQLQEENE